MTDMMKRLREDGQMGCDLSPGDPVAAWAFKRINKLERLIRYTDHDKSCATVWDGQCDTYCDCGFDNLIKELRNDVEKEKD